MQLGFTQSAETLCNGAIVLARPASAAAGAERRTHDGAAAWDMAGSGNDAVGAGGCVGGSVLVAKRQSGGT